MDTTTYSPPVDKLLTYGEAEPAGSKDWPNYLELGLGPEHIPDLIRLATDTELRWAEMEEDRPEYWAPIHAWRTLGQLHAEAAVEPILSVLDKLVDDEWSMEELPEVFGMIGPPAIPALRAFIADASHEVWTRVCTMDSLEQIGRRHPEAKAECITVLTRQLDLFAENDPTINAFLISSLMSLKAQEALPLIEQAFEAGSVDELVVNWNDVQVEFGLKEREELDERIRALLSTPLPPPPMPEESITTPVFSRPPSPPLPRGHSAGSTRKAKKKLAKASRKKNRKRR